VRTAPINPRGKKMLEHYYVIRWTFHYVGAKYYYSKCKRFETEQEANQFKFELLHHPDIEVVEYEKQFVEKWKNA
jgi:hypothetical protein